jgi:uncharacterized protein YndB with AHSA1/START domain
MESDTRTPAPTPNLSDLPMRVGAIDIATGSDDLELVFSRRFDVPRALLFRAFSSCEHLVHWWGPTGWTLPVCEQDFRAGGSWDYCMQGPNGEMSCGRSLYREIVEPERIVYTDLFVDPAGKVMEDMPALDVTIEFTERDSGTVLLNRLRLASRADVETMLGTGMVEGMAQTWDRLAAYLARA